LGAGAGPYRCGNQWQWRKAGGLLSTVNDWMEVEGLNHWEEGIKVMEVICPPALRLRLPFELRQLIWCWLSLNPRTVMITREVPVLWSEFLLEGGGVLVMWCMIQRKEDRRKGKVVLIGRYLFGNFVAKNNFVFIVPAHVLLVQGYSFKKVWPTLHAVFQIRSSQCEEFQAGLRQNARPVAPTAQRDNWRVAWEFAAIKAIGVYVRGTGCEGCHQGVSEVSVLVSQGVGVKRGGL
jgi:hypothetical protein